MERTATSKKRTEEVVNAAAPAKRWKGQVLTLIVLLTSIGFAAHFQIVRAHFWFAFVEFVSCLAFAWGAWNFYMAYWSRVDSTTWYDIAAKGWLGKLTWEQVSELMKQDPVSHEKSRRGWFIFRWVIASIAAFVFGSLLFRAVQLLFNHHRPDDIDRAVKLLGTSSLIGGIAKVVYDWKLKARTENRQKWVNDVRETLAVLIENMPLPTDTSANSEQKQSQYFKMHGKLELLLNPAEKEHRGLMTLIRYIYGHRVPGIDSEAANRLTIRVDGQDLSLKNADLSNQPHFDQMKTAAIRLSNVVLKREWERVKHIQ